MFRSIFKSAPKKTVPDEHLPVLHSFVDVTVMGRPARSVSVEEVGPRFVAVKEVLGRAGERGALVYHTPAGRFRFGAAIAKVEAGMTYFEIPARVESIAGSAQKRASVRLDTLVNGMWRMAPGGKGVGDFMKGSVRDISRGGCALIIGRQCKVGQWLEIQLLLRAAQPPVQLMGEVMRVEQVPTSGKYSHGLRFHGITAAEDRAILDYINWKTKELRDRGLA